MFSWREGYLTKLNNFIKIYFDNKRKKKYKEKRESVGVITHTFASEYPKLTENYTWSLSPLLNFTIQNPISYFSHNTHTLSRSLPIHSFSNSIPKPLPTTLPFFFFLFAFGDKLWRLLFKTSTFRSLHHHRQSLPRF